MALLDSISLYTNVTKIGKWANGKYGEILPTEQNTHIFIEFEDRNGSLCYKYTEEERNAKAPVLAYGFVNYWLRNRKRKTIFAERLDLCPPKGGYKIPKEIYDSYIDAHKKWFVETMKNRADAWKYPDLEKLFYERNLTVESENELVVKSEPLLEYLDDEDKEEMSFIMKNFFEYLNQIIKPYQHNMGNDIEYSIDSPEILDCAKKLEPIQVEILSQLVINNNQIKTWQENPVLNQYSEKEIFEAASDLDGKGLISGFFDMGHASWFVMRDTGKLVLRKYKMLKNKDVSNKVLPQEIAIPEEYKEFVESVFLKTYRFGDKEFQTYPQVKEAFEKCIDPYEPVQVPIFIEACITQKCARESARGQADKLVKALIGLNVLKFVSEDAFEKYRNNVGRKMRRLGKTEFNEKEQELYNDVLDHLSRPLQE